MRVLKTRIDPHFDTLLLLRAFGEQERLVSICAFHAEEAVGGVAYPRGQHFVTQHGVDHRAFPVTRSGKRKQILFTNVFMILLSNCSLN